MKRIAKLLCLIALVALVGTSCKKQEAKLTFTATMGDGEWKTEDKLYLADNKKMWFEAGDEVMLCNVKYDNPSLSTSGRFYAETDGVSTTFRPVGGTTTLDDGKLDAFFAYYPGEEGMCSFVWEGTSGETYHPETYNNYGCFRLAPTQDYRTVGSGTAVPKKAFYAAAKDEQISSWNDAHFSFTPIGGLLKLNLYNPTTSYVKSIKVTDPSRNLVGNVYLCIDKVDPYEMEQILLNYNPESQLYLNRLAAYCQKIGYRVPGHNEPIIDDETHQVVGHHDANPELSHDLTLNCVTTEYPNGVQIGTTSNTATEFVLGVRPAAFYDGLTLEVVYMTGSVEHKFTISTNYNLMIKPAHIKNLAALKITPNVY